MYATVSGFEIPTRDPERSARFYREVFNWSVEPVAWAGPPYYRVGTAILKLGTAREGIDGGLTRPDRCQPSGELARLLHENQRPCCGRTDVYTL